MAGRARISQIDEAAGNDRSNISFAQSDSNLMNGDDFPLLDGFLYEIHSRGPAFVPVVERGRNALSVRPPDEPANLWPRIFGVFKHLDEDATSGAGEGEGTFFDQKKLAELQDPQVKAMQYLDGVVEEVFDTVPENTYITITADRGELCGEGGYFSHRPIMHKKIFEVPFIEGKIRQVLIE